MYQSEIHTFINENYFLFEPEYKKALNSGDYRHIHQHIPKHMSLNEMHNAIDWRFHIE